MTTVDTATARGPARTGTIDGRTSPLPALRRRRSTPHILLGAVLVAVFGLGFAVTALRVDPRTAVLALAGPVAAGHVLTDADLTVVRIVPDPSLGVLPEAQRSAVVGRTLRLPMAAHSLLSSDALGPAAWPPKGESLIAVSVKAGRVPSGVEAGAPVLVLVVPGASSTGGDPANPLAVPQARATVVSVIAADSSGASVVSLLMTSADAVSIVGAAGEVALVVQGGTG
jgi:SAF domain-containing protein